MAKRKSNATERRGCGGEPCCAIGIDLGGQSIKSALVDHAGAILVQTAVAVDAADSAERFAVTLLRQIADRMDDAKGRGMSPVGAGVVMPGYMDRQRTRLLLAANLPTLSGSDLLERVRAGSPIPVVFDADCNAAALAEYCFGAGVDCPRLIVATIGTGIGGGVVMGGEILRIRNHIGGSLGHVIVDAKGPRCKCGARGCVEAHASGPALEKLADELAENEPTSLLAQLRAERGRLTGREIREALKQQDPVALRAVQQCGWWLGVGVASWSAIYSPEKVLFGGGIAGLGEPLLQAIRTGFWEVAQPALREQVAIELAALGNDAGVIGAAAMALSVEPHDGPR